MPDGAIGKKAYSLIQRAMEEEGLHGIAQFVLAGREQLMLLRPIGKFLTLTDLHNAEEVREPSKFEDEIDKGEYKPQELTLAKQLMEGMLEKKFDPADYPDPYATKLKELVQAKAQGKELVAPEGEEQPVIVNIMEALKASLGEAGAKPTRKMVGSRKRRTAKKARKRSAG